jgi:hypothetical protein
LRSRELALGERTLVMGILNVTPDSFSDGGRFLSRDHAVGHALQMLDEGADLIDIGGESTRPGARVAANGVSAEEELERIMPVIGDIRRERPATIISVDTYKASTARAALAAQPVPETRGQLQASRPAAHDHDAMQPIGRDGRCGVPARGRLHRGSPVHLFGDRSHRRLRFIEGQQ